MNSSVSFIVACTWMLSASFFASAEEQQPTVDEPRMEELKVLVVDKDDTPIRGVTVRPWALGSGQIHSVWGPRERNPDVSGTQPKEVCTDDAGPAKVYYPFYRHALEKTRTLVVTVFLSHSEYTYSSEEHIHVPVAGIGTHKIVMTRMASLDVTPVLKEVKWEIGEIHAFWSNGRSRDADYSPERPGNQSLRISGFLPGVNSVMAARIAGGKLTHFSRVTEFAAEEGGQHKLELPLQRAIQVVGKLSENVPRPVRNGRVVARSIPSSSGNGVVWTDWAVVKEDGKFVFEAWPAGERIQLIALCDGFIATSGEAPSEELEIENDAYHRPHVYESHADSIEVP